ncbi:hypothetical protein Tco_0922361 [Tanacetum coccineum]|uniref:Reverse transcriptase domain-containing protein n=1 Tax=Tanacetum coccineum TaxID=301880 RepID=A0ABQ5CZI9_9ASTR
MPRECLKIIESKSKVCQSRSKAIVSKVSTSSSTPSVSSDIAELKDMVRALILDKKNQTPAPAPVKAVEQSCVTCGGGHSYQNCLATDGNIYRDNRIHKDGDGDASFQLESNSLPHAHAQTTKTYYKHQDSRIMKAQELKTKTVRTTLIYKILLYRYQVYQEDYRKVAKTIKKQGKDLKISDIKTKSKDNDKGSRSKITKHEGTSLQRIQRPRPQDLNDKSNLINLMKECHNELTLGEIVSLKILSRTMEVRSLY